MIKKRDSQSLLLKLKLSITTTKAVAYLNRSVPCVKTLVRKEKLYILLPDPGVLLFCLFVFANNVTRTWSQLYRSKYDIFPFLILKSDLATIPLYETGINLSSLALRHVR